MHRNVVVLVLCLIGALAGGWASGPTWETDREATLLVGQARGDLASRLHVPESAIEVTHVHPRRFSDRSLGVRRIEATYDPDEVQGYVIRLEFAELLYEYRGYDRQLRRVPARPDGCTPPEDVLLVDLYAYNAQVDVEIHGHVACSADAVLPIQRWVPASDGPVVDTLRLLLQGGLLPEEKEAGYSTEFPLRGVELQGLSVADGVLELSFADPHHETTGGACRTGILWAQIEKTVRQFPGVEEVIAPAELFQP